LAAFFGSAALTPIAITYGYFSESLPEWYLTETDHAIISTVNLGKWQETCFATIYNLKCKIRRALGRKVLPRRQRLSRAQREAVVTRFILALSDQQLVTGLAILAGTVANQCTLSGYDFKMAFSLAWFSSITHLATLDVLRDYLIKHRTVRKWRIWGMVGMLILLIYFLGVASNLDPTIPAQCIFEIRNISIFQWSSVVVLYIPVLVITVIFLVANY